MANREVLERLTALAIVVAGISAGIWMMANVDANAGAFVTGLSGLAGAIILLLTGTKPKTCTPRP